MAAIPKVRCATLGYWILPPAGDDGRENWIFANVPILTERSITCDVPFGCEPADDAQSVASHPRALPQ